MKNQETARRRDNLESIRKNLQPIIGQKVFSWITSSDIQGLLVHRNGNYLELYCYDKSTKAMSDIMSQIDLMDPLRLISPYTQSMFLALCWNKHPQNVYIAGFGAGCLPALFHHLYRDIHVHGSDIDPNMIEVSKKFFAVEFDERYSINICDSRDDLQTRYTLYDIILLDTFYADGNHTDHLATQEFITLCKQKMVKHGVLAANIIQADPLHISKISAIHAVFKYCTAWFYKGAWVIFGSDQKLSKENIVTRAKIIENNENLKFPYLDHANLLEDIPSVSTAAPLKDADLVQEFKKTSWWPPLTCVSIGSIVLQSSR